MNDCNIIQFPRGRDLYGLIRYPHLGIRFGPVAGARLPIAISRGPYCFILKNGDTRLIHPDPFNSDGSVTEGLRAALLWEAVQLARRSWRPTVYWAEDASSTVWANAIQDRMAGKEIELPVETSLLVRGDVDELLGTLRQRRTAI